jgi:radical SAM protein with 4Fe4S-binding SPASM domain
MNSEHSDDLDTDIIDDISLISCEVEITYECNLSCPFCFIKSQSANHIASMNPKAMRKVVTFLKSIGVMLTSISGGEPTLNPNMIDMVRDLRKADIEVVVATNGLTLTKTLLEQLYALKILNLQVALEAPTAKVHDAIRGEGTFNRVLHALELASDSGITTAVVTTITKANADSLQAFPRFLKSIGVKNHVILRCTTYDPMDSHVLERERFVQVLGDLFKEAEKNSIQIGSSSPIIKWLSHVYESKGLESNEDYDFSCPAVKRSITITPSLNIKPCSPSNVDLGSIAGIKSFNDFAEKMSRNPIARSFIRPKPQKCQNCLHYGFCRSGCRIAAYKAHGTYEAPDAYCLRDFSSLDQVFKTTVSSKQ